eukprot:m.13715 g.13715  ORF g.13715 m.13715 type:complete len:301 (-) comp6261_c0_seq1:158-1060(-)
MADEDGERELGVMSLKDYEAIEAEITDRESLWTIASARGLPYSSIRSIYSIKVTEQAKRDHGFHVGQSVKYWARVKEQLLSAARPGLLLQMAEEYNTQPYLMAKFVLEGLGGFEGAKKKMNPVLRDFLKDPKSIDANLARVGEGAAMREALVREVNLCIEQDDTRGPLVDLCNENVGLRFEALLSQHLMAAGIRFLDDGENRALALNKTPDALLLTSAAVYGQEIRWMDSKGMFGDAATLKTNFEEQFLPYTRRYGAGLVIYWFGYVREVARELEERAHTASYAAPVFIVACFPDDIVVL